MTKGTPHQLFARRLDRQRAEGEAARPRFVDEMEVRGREAKIKLWSIADGAAAATDS